MQTQLQSQTREQSLLDRPLIALTEIAAHLKKPIGQLRKLCALPAPIPIPVRMDPVYGELLSLAATHALIKRTLTFPGGVPALPVPPACHDRITLLLWMCGLDMSAIPRTRGRTMRSYAYSVETEIKRIARIKDPTNRVLRALDLLGRYVDARKLAEGFWSAHKPVEMERIERKLEEVIGAA